MDINPLRTHLWRSGPGGRGPVVYWMSRDQRVGDNWALLHAFALSVSHRRPLHVVFCLADGFLGAGLRQYAFMLAGLREVAAGCAARGIRFELLRGDPGEGVAAYCRGVAAGAVVTDFDPMRVKGGWKRAVTAAVDADVYETDAHNVVPCRVASGKREYGARTLRPKIGRLLPEYLEDFPELPEHPYGERGLGGELDVAAVLAGLGADGGVPPVADILPGERAAGAALRDFVEKRLPGYAQGRNDPNTGMVSGLSPYFHFGQLAPQRAVLSVVAAGREAGQENVDAFVEECVVRRELSDNFCLHCPDYDRFEGLPDWGKRTLTAHASDRREFVYSREDFARGLTHSDLWNAAQAQLRETGRMHGYMRMYWAKKILEWSSTPQEALDTAVWLNDRFALDGRDPNGYVGVLWSVGGLHDRPWTERPVYGQVRYMNERGCRRKFDVDAYIAAHLPALPGASG
ncbi:deoxyribodipyrimidine photo-lyase [Desulfolutivibrio sulfodismutans]|nr:deoxyribodipyrimidine photo-lyase [Desulfolutivibrio sulfodismutans]QLA13654.1 deoxyribodipyrimidine photo-lyase [Desulfolutivibrio sulfodismutans DSM 3696]